MTRGAHTTLAPRAEESGLVKTSPFLRLVEDERRIDDAQPLGTERRGLQVAARGHETAFDEQALRLLADHEVVVEERGMRMRRGTRQRQAIRAGNRRRNNEPAERRSLAFQLLGGEV